MESLISNIRETLDLPLEMSPRRTDVRAKLDPMVERVQAAFGFDFVNDFTELFAELHTDNDEREFHLGFVTGAKLMMEILG